MSSSPESPGLSLPQYAARYSSRNLVKRLLFVAEHSTDPAMTAQALQLAADELKMGKDTKTFSDVVAASQGAVPADAAWVKRVETLLPQEEKDLQDQLDAARSNMQKDRIREGHNKLGDFFYSSGSLQAALKSYVRAKDYCATNEHHIEMFLNVIRVSAELDQFTSVSTYAMRGEQALGARPTDTVALAKFRAAAGLAELRRGSFEEAANRFVTVLPDLGTSFTDVVAGEDVATYGALCALAKYDRAKLREKVLDNSNFRGFLELVPPLRTVVTDFAHSRYGSCLKGLKDYVNTLLLDKHIRFHVRSLVSDIRRRALVQYCKPYSVVTLPAMASAFNTKLDDLETELASLIESKMIDARLDSHNKALVARYKDDRATTFERSAITTDKFCRETNILLLRMNLMRYNLVHKKKASRPDMMRGASAEDDMDMIDELGGGMPVSHPSDSYMA